MSRSSRSPYGAGGAQTRERHWQRAVRTRSAHHRRHRHRPGRRGPSAPRGGHRALGAVLMVLATALLLGGGLVAYELARTHDRLVAARNLLQRATANPQALITREGRRAAAASVDQAVAAATDARDRVRNAFPLRLIQDVPLLSTQRQGLVELTADAVEAAEVARDLLATFDRLASGAALVDGRIPIADLRALGRALGDGGRRLAAIEPGGGRLWGPLRDARRDLDDVVGSNADRLHLGSETVEAALTFMGADEPRSYLVGLQNNAEMRDQGMVLSYAVVDFAGGRLSFRDRFGSVLDLRLDRPVATPLPAGTEEVFGPLQPTQLWQSVNATADFALSGRTMVEMYAAATGERLDGVIAVDVPALALLLATIGPVEVDGLPGPVTAANVADVLLRDIYEGVPPSDDPVRREKQAEVTQAVIERITNGAVSGVEVGLRLAEAARGLHLRLWSADADEEAVFERSGLGGGPAVEDPSRTFHLAVQNRTATKLDYYVRTRVRYDVALTDDGDAILETTVVIDNQAPDVRAPTFALGPDRVQSRPGEYHAWVLHWVPLASEPAGTNVEESGLRLSQRVVIVGPGEQVEVRLPRVTIPHAVQDGQLRLRLVPQPRLHPPELEVNLSTSGWRVSGDIRWDGPWDRVVRPAWDVRR